MHTHSNSKLTEPVRKEAVEFALCVCVHAGGRRGETLLCTPREMSPDSVLILRGGMQGSVWSLQGYRFLQGRKSASQWVSRPGSAGSHRGTGQGRQGGRAEQERGDGEVVGRRGAPTAWGRLCLVSVLRT